MGIIPLQFLSGESAESLKLTGKESYSIDIPSDIVPGQVIRVQVWKTLSSSFRPKNVFISFNWRALSSSLSAGRWWAELSGQGPLWHRHRTGLLQSIIKEFSTSWFARWSSEFILPDSWLITDAPLLVVAKTSYTGIFFFFFNLVTIEWCRWKAENQKMNREI